MTALASDDHPLDVLQMVAQIDSLQERLDRQEPDFRWSVRQQRDAAVSPVLVLDRHSRPDVVGPVRAVAPVDVLQHSFRALCKYLVDVLVVLGHSQEHLSHEVERHLLVEEVAHAVHEHPSPRSPLAGGIEPVVVEPDRRLARQKRTATLEPQRDAFRVAVGASRADLRAAGYRVPCSVRPFDSAVIRHCFRQQRDANNSRTLVRLLSSRIRFTNAGRGRGRIHHRGATIAHPYSNAASWSQSAA